MAKPDVTILLQNGGLNRRSPNDDMISGLVMHGVAVAPGPGVGGIALQEAVLLESERQARDLGLTAEYDDANEVLVYYHIKEFFRINPSGKLWILLAAQTVTDWEDLVDETLTTNAIKLLKAAEGNIRQLGVAFNPADDDTPSYANELDTRVPLVISKAQALAEGEFTRHRPVQIVVEGRMEASATIASLTNLHTLDAENVSVVIAQDPDAPLSGPRARSAAVGTLLGQLSKIGVHLNVGYVSLGNLTGDAAWLSAGLSDGTLYADRTDADTDSLHDKGYIFARYHTGRAGYYFNGDATCTLATSDYNSIRNNRTVQKAARLVRNAYLPTLNGPIQVDPTTGKLDRITVAGLETVGGTALRDMVRTGEVSGEPTVVIDPEQNILSDATLKVQFSIVPVGCAEQITVYLGFENPFGGA